MYLQTTGVELLVKQVNIPDTKDAVVRLNPHFSCIPDKVFFDFHLC